MEKVVKDLMDVRRSKDISADVLAEKMDLSVQAIYKWIYGYGSPSVNHLHKLADILGCEIKVVPKEKDSNAHS